ncbi:mucin-2-like [Scylla paramamosain]|uniref:mucin-2-like n=1 Tax=Scylla paramamosain TaxID=85552 RepID=UPI0030828732
MDDSLDFLKDGATPRTLLRRFMAVADVQETPIPFRTRGAGAKNASTQETQSGAKKRRSTRISKGEQSMSREVLRQQAKQSSSFMDQTLNASVIQGANQTYANIVAQDSDSSSSLITSFDMEKAAKWQKRKKKKLEDASVPAEVVPKPPAKKKSKKRGLPSTNTTIASISEKGKSGEKAADTTNILAQEIQPDEPQTQSTHPAIEANAAGNKSKVSLLSTASPVAGAEKIISDVSADVSSLADGSYSFISEKDDSHLNIEKTKVRFSNQIKSRKLNLPSIIELLPTKQKFTDPQTIASAEDALDAPDLQAPSSAESPAVSPEASQELNNKTSQDMSNDFIPPPLSFRDDDTFTTDTLREANFSAHDMVNRISATFIHQEEPEASQGLLNVQEEDAPIDLKGTPAGQLKPVSEVITPTPMLTRSAQRKSVGEVIPTRSSQKSVAEVTATTTPKRSAQRKIVGEVTATITPTRSSQKNVAEVTATITPTRSAQRKSVGEVTATTTPTRSAQKSVGEVTATITPTRSSQRKSVDEVTATTTPTRSSQRKSVGEITATITPTRSSQMSVAEVTATSTPKRPSQRKSVGEVTATTTPTVSRRSVGKNVTSVLVSPQIEDTSGASSHPEGEESHDAQEIGESAQGVSGGDEEDELKDESSNKKRRMSGSLSKGAAQDVLPEDAIEEAPLSDSEDEYYPNSEPVHLSFHGNDRSMTTASPVDALKVKTTPTPKVQPPVPFTTAKVRQMTMKEFLEQLKTKPVPPPVPKPKPLLASLLGASSSSKILAKPPQKRKRKRGTKTPELPATLPRSLTKELFTHFTKCRVTSAAVEEVVKCSEIFWSSLTKDIFSTVSDTSNQIEASDVEKVMKRVKIITPEQTVNSLVEELLPMEMWDMFMPLPDAAKNPFPPLTGKLPNLYQPDDLEEDESAVK